MAVIRESRERVKQIADAPQALSGQRSLIELRVTQKIKTPTWARISGVITGFPYEGDQEIKNLDGMVIGNYNEAEGTLTAFPVKYSDYQTFVDACISEFGGIENRNPEIGESVVFKIGDIVSLSCDNDVNLRNVADFSLVVVGVNVAHYCRKIDEQRADVAERKANGELDALPQIGVSQKIKQIEVKEPANPIKVMNMFLSNPEHLQLPLKTPRQLIAENGYVWRRIDEKKTPKHRANSPVYIPLIQDNKLVAETFGAGASLTGFFDIPDENHLFYLGKTDGLTYSCFRGSLKLTSIPETRTEDGKWRAPTPADMVFFVCPLASWSPLEGCMIRGAETWINYGRLILNSIDMVLVADVDLYGTCASPLNQETNPVENEHELRLMPRTFMCDFAGFLMDRGLPCARKAVQKWISEKDTRFQSFTQPRDKKSKKAAGKPTRIMRNQLDDGAAMMFLNEWTESELGVWLAGDESKHFGFYALIPDMNEDRVKMRAAAIREFAAAKGADYEGPLADPLICLKWDVDPEYYRSYLGDDMALPDDHPLRKMPMSSQCKKDQQVLLYAVDLRARSKEIKDASKHPLSIGAPGEKRQRAIEAAPGGSESDASESAEAVELPPAKIRMVDESQAVEEDDASDELQDSASSANGDMSD